MQQAKKRVEPRLDGYAVGDRN
jgi:hypothetical protein